MKAYNNKAKAKCIKATLTSYLTSKVKSSYIGHGFLLYDTILYESMSKQKLFHTCFIKIFDNKYFSFPEFGLI